MYYVRGNKNNLNIKLNEFLLQYTNKSPAEILFSRKLRCRLGLSTNSLPSFTDAKVD